MVKIAINVEPNGQVSATEVIETTLSNADVETCILTAVNRWIFPEASIKSVIKYPFQLKTAN